MGAPRALLKNPPRSFQLAIGGMHQDIDIISREEGTTFAHHMIDFVARKDYAELRNYLNAILNCEGISTSDLKGLFNRQPSDWHLGAAAVRDLFVSLRDELSMRLDRNG